MRRILFGLMTVALLASCTQKPTFNVQGTISSDKFADSTKIYLQEDGEGKIKIDSTTIVGGKFEFKGVRETPYVAYIACKMSDGNPFITPIALEAGKTAEDVITIAIAENVKIAGSPLNDIMQKQFDVEIKDMEAMQAIYAKARELDRNSPEMEELGNQIDSTQQAAIDKTYAAIKENANTIVGPFFLANRMHSFKLDQLKELVALFPENLKSDKRTVLVLENIARQEAVAVGQKFVDLKGMTPDGKEIALSDYAGKGNVVLLDFWASWCGPCIAEMPHVKEAYKKYHEQGFEIVAVSIDNKKEAWVDAIAKYEITWPQMSDLKGWTSDISKVYNVRSIPHTVLIDKDGTIVAKDVRGEDVSIKVGELLSK